MTYTATRRRALHLLFFTLVLVALAGWAARHALAALQLLHGHHYPYQGIYTFAFIVFALQMILAYLEAPARTDRPQAAYVDDLSVYVNIPVYNEDPALLAESIRSLLRQTRPPQAIHVVDDGSQVDYTAVRAAAEDEAAAAGIRFVWVRQLNGGKRTAQAFTFRSSARADIFLTVDSDTILDPNAIAEGLRPFGDPRVTSVAGVVLSANARSSMVTALLDMWFVTAQLTDRSMASRLGSVTVNSGAFALYRADVIRPHVDGYLHETFAGREVKFSDDSMLTTYALLAGRAVQQPSAYAFAAMPDNIRHHLRQYTRWMRGAFIRSFWRWRYLPIRSWAYWMHAVRWVGTITGLVVFVALFIVEPAKNPAVVPYYLMVPLLIGYAQALRYLAVRRGDLNVWRQLAVVALSPVTWLWVFFVLRFVRWYAIGTCLRNGWGTRQQVEVSLSPAQAAA